VTQVNKYFLKIILPEEVYLVKLKSYLRYLPGNLKKHQVTLSGKKPQVNVTR